MRRLSSSAVVVILLIGIAWLGGSPAYGATVFTDTFTSRDTSRWTWGGGAAVSGGRLTLADTTSFSTVTTTAGYDLETFDVEVVSRPSGSVMAVAASAGNRSIEWYLDGNTLGGYVDDVEHVRTAWSATSTRWLRFAVDGSRVVFSTSPNGQSWTERGSAPLRWSTSTVRLSLTAGRWSGRATSGGVALDNATLATRSVATPSNSPTPSASATVPSSPPTTPASSPTPLASATPSSSPTGSSGASAAERYGWGTPFAGSEFTDPDMLWGPDWDIYWGPGYQGKGQQSDDALEVKDGRLVIIGDPDGNTGGVAYTGAVQKYGRWESRIRIPEGYGTYHPVALLWPWSGRWPADGEIDYFEATGSADRSTFSLHHGGGNPQVTEIRIDRAWHTYAVEWTPTSITAYYDGQQYYRTTNTRLFPPGPMWHSFQLDWMGVRGGPTTVMEVDWLRIYRID